MYGFLFVFFSNFVPEMHHFLDIWLQKCCDLENGVLGVVKVIVNVTVR